jgi:hypothetical protein
MRLLSYLTESTYIEPDKIKRDCAKFLKEVGDRVPLYRGLKYPLYDDIQFKTPRKDRQPSDTPLQQHKVLDELFFKEHGWKARSEGVFVTNSSNQALQFGKPTRFIPVGNYKYLYNPSIRDLYTRMLEMGNTQHMDDYNSPSIMRDFKRYVEGYTDKGLENLTNSRTGTEIMFYCPDGYYLIGDDYMKKNWSSIFK